LFFAPFCRCRYLHSSPTRRSSDLFLGLSIRKKLALVTLFTSLVALLLASGTILTCQMFQMRNVLARELTTQAEIVGANCSAALRSEEHTSELQSRENLVCGLLLEK